MKQVLIISFDIIRNGEPPVSLAIGSLLSYLKNDKRYEKAFAVEHIPFNLNDNSPLSIETIISVIEAKYDLKKLHAIALSCYVWSEYIINKLIVQLRLRGFKNKIILGGYQISYIENIEKDYSDCQIFVVGEGEQSLLEAIHYDLKEMVKLNKFMDPRKTVSPYIDNTIPVAQEQKKVRMETKRGCYFDCNFCAHKDLIRPSIFCFPTDKVFDEISFFKEKAVSKINIVDPTFNIGKNYLEILEYCAQIGLKSLVSLQVRLESIRGKEGERLLQLCSSLNTILEFGIQTIIPDEMKVLNRNNDLEHIKYVMNQLNIRRIPYEASLIYGIPNQTVKSFKTSIEFLKIHGCKTIKAYGLMILKGTTLWKQRHEWRLKETIQGKYLMPYVTSSNTFNLGDWEEMKEIAESLKNTTPEEKYADS